MSILIKSYNKGIKVTILAAGSGRRLKLDLPKAMVEIHKNISILEHQVNNLKEYIEIDDIYIIVGYKKEMIMEHFSNLAYIYNKDFDITNTAKSLLLGLKKLRGNDVLWLNGDVVFDPGIIQDILDNRGNNLICVNNNRVSSEEVKYKIDNRGFISEISKNVLNGLGEAVGINYIKKDCLDTFIESLGKCNDMDYFESGMELAIKEKTINFTPLNVCDRFCMEIDFKKDLYQARQHYKKALQKFE